MRRESDFWSRRRARVEAEERAEGRAAQERAEGAQATQLAAKPDDEILAELGLPLPESLGSGDDIAAFMSRAVPEHLRRRALRALWTSNPVLANLDGLVDYAEDYTDAARVVPGMKTSYEVGRGLLRHIEHVAHSSEAEESEDRIAAPEPFDIAPPEDAPAEAPAAEVQTTRPEDGDEVIAMPQPRRMTFQFEGSET